jgi:multidrug efflux pump subunit AcrB
LRQVNINAAGGEAQVGGTRQSLRVLGNADSAYDLSQTEISLANGRSVKLADIATVRDAESERRSISKVKGREVVNFAMSRARGSSDVTVYEDSLKVMEKITAENPGVEFIPLGNSVDYTKGQYKSSIAAMIEGAVLAVVVVFLFLRDWRATMISAISISYHCSRWAWLRGCWSTMPLSKLKISFGICEWANPPIKRRLMPPTKLVWPWLRRHFVSSLCSCPWD